MAKAKKKCIDPDKKISVPTKLEFDDLISMSLKPKKVKSSKKKK